MPLSQLNVTSKANGFPLQVILLIKKNYTFWILNSTRHHRGSPLFDQFKSLHTFILDTHISKNHCNTFVSHAWYFLYHEDLHATS